MCCIYMILLSMVHNYMHGATVYHNMVVCFVYMVRCVCVCGGGVHVSYLLVGEPPGNTLSLGHCG